MIIKKYVKKITPFFLLNLYHLFLPALGAFFYGFPSRKLKVIGITGTNGKSTVVSLVAEVLREAGYKVASLSSVNFKIGEKEWQNDLKMTMPGRFKLQRFLRKALDSGCQYVVLEVTSEGIKQYRHKFIRFEAAVITNLTPEHIEAHGGFEKYKEAKGKLFKSTKWIHVVNLDDENTDYFLKMSSKKKYGYTIKKSASKMQVVKAENVEVGSDSIGFSVNNVKINMSLMGIFNIYNALAAICVGFSQNIDISIIKKALENFKGVPGRMEVVLKEPFLTIVDYAHTPDALEKVYKAVQNKKICVLGSCGGGRDKWKRPELGKIANNYCDQIILTDEDPYDEDPSQIISQVESGIKEKPVIKILNRREAIKKALSLAEPGEAVVITGKGSEPWMCVAGGKKIPWNERKTVLEEYEKVFKNL
ncbi:MAG: UDP-N-acetylmuramoyl-L-alanyl-D-glutamate--2,6-diaminopimelate ligase [Candidatus Nealsonbacteria bacterium]